MLDRGNVSYVGRKQQVILQGMELATKFWSRNECHPRLFSRTQGSRFPDQKEKNTPNAVLFGKAKELPTLKREAAQPGLDFWPWRDMNPQERSASL